MKLDSVRIENFLGIRLVEAQELGDTIIVAGQNGSGKSAIFEAIKLLKSSYGGYQPGEWQQFFNERQIQIQGRYKNVSGIFNDPTRAIDIRAALVFHPDERSYISSNIDNLIASTLWQGHNFSGFSMEGHRQAEALSQQKEFEKQVKEAVDHYRPIVLEELTRPSVEIGVHIEPSEEVSTTPSLLTNLAFSNFLPRQIGLIDYHSAQRHYNRENIGGVNLNLQQAEQNYSQNALYNINNKYNNVKSEMASNFVAELLSEHATGIPPSAVGSITASMKELFATFFPDKEFRGPQATKEGSLKFPVRVSGGSEHDIDDLSSGEKEIVYGYLRMRSSAPKYSIILIDEPELHLNPRLIRKLPEFYRRNLGELLDNQLWLVTHADSLIREAVGKSSFNVFHMTPPTSEAGNQLRALTLTEELDAAVADLVGDLAAYRPGGRCILVEGGGDSEFDRRMLHALFPDDLQGVNVISSADKTKVKSLHKTLERAYSEGHLRTKFFAVTDRDNDTPVEEISGISLYSWDAYHIENYLLDFASVAKAVNIIQGVLVSNANGVEIDLREAARQLVPELVQLEVRHHVNRQMVGNLNLKIEEGTGSIAERFVEAAMKSKDRIMQVVDDDGFLASVNQAELDARARLERALADGTWVSTFPGRDVLKRFVTDKSLGQYERFRNVLLSCMGNDSVKPAGMARVLAAILAS